MQPNIRVTLFDEDGERFFGEGPCRLLHAIEQTGSLRAAAQSMQMAYTKALGLVRHAEQVLGFALTERKIGGKGGGGSLYSRFGFSDVLTMFLVLDAQVELYKGGIVPLSEYAERPKDRDILVRIIVPKKNAKFNYQSVRISQTDIPVLTCASVKDENGYRFAIGARPARAQIYAQPVDKTAEQMAEAVRAEIKTGSSLRGSAEYRRHLAGVLVRRAAHALDAE